MVDQDFIAKKRLLWYWGMGASTQLYGYLSSDLKTVNNWFKGNLAYLLRSTNNLLVIEAKNDDLTRGFTQLAVELIALSHIEEQNVFYGAVTMGDIWRFGNLDRTQQQITQDINLFKVPDDLDNLVRVLIGILEGVSQDNPSITNN